VTTVLGVVKYKLAPVPGTRTLYRNIFSTYIYYIYRVLYICTNTSTRISVKHSKCVCRFSIFVRAVLILAPVRTGRYSEACNTPKLVLQVTSTSSTF
jgi:hypothetical protein